MFQNRMMLHSFTYFSELLQRNVHDVVRDKKGKCADRPEKIYPAYTQDGG
jgi:hypothetical protein